MPTIVPSVSVYAGDSLVFPTYTFKTSGVAVDLSTWTFSAMWRPSAFAVEPIALTVDASAAALGVVSVSASAAQTRAMGKSGVWDLQGTKGAVVQTFIAGATSYVEDVTR